MRYIIFILVFIILVSSCKNTIKEPIDPDTYYTCSMDPQVVEYKPGKCPICKMDLTPVKKRKGESQDELELSEQQIQLGNILVDTIRNGTINDQLILTASLNFDQSKLYAVSSRVMGRVEKLYFKNLGEYVKKGSPLYEMYSEDLNNAKQEYLLAIDKKNAFSSQAIIDFDQLIQGAKNKLLLWGLTEMQLSELANTRKASPITTYYSTAGGYITQLDIREGDYVMEGGTIVKLADLSTLWVEAQVYSSQLADLQENSMVTVQLPDFNNKEIKGKLEFVNPEINQATRINLVRIPIPNPGNYLKPGMSAYVLLKSPRRKSLSLPIDAVIRDGKGATVWVQTGKNTFKNLMVQTGLESDDRIEIISGLSEGDIVVLKGAYLLHSEYIFKKGANPMEGMKM
ncbi:MAG TPA: efflux RND transporter periplasmic adaptor subunit [Sediminibacterium sp.]|jgi:membrane fusion protein, copper/silver efflux system|uniref:efflux RND transporter periplasmic adaptor subunit n=1 Tax=Sediminibacterium sp. TaxID=1917865 RepID=UPI0008D6C628|nr:efflux RND transporter periplasmic adaptor subunit [Sediminibacterium sp.]OHC85207.1 MAG: efflux transporter periplasmic adaptor subunit [Sphingobacteriia bacterium RIFOXYC2_FULL_35_18]OHC89113.1 MAG: efflux transporter periplasmic adaptor subunit [Sphingobacteriia bacterium RIFOXYD2_FULL_35_12]OYZ03102.1 MAG: efflux transporter periplasmic adaptor subunit [Sphingobacteriia bacterium 28-36-52]HLD53485.1 efflux RND transporter periplasmic adaptor subunit [Sediminibacterium sp.]